MSSPSLDDLGQVEELVEQFEAAWRRGERPRVEECVAGLPERLRALLVQQLVPLEIEPRHSRGELTTDEEFRARLPDYVEAVGAVLGWTWGITSDSPACAPGGPSSRPRVGSRLASSSTA
jgi:hypothetical protein